MSDQSMPATLMGKCVPAEYTSSPLVDILASTAKDTVNFFWSMLIFKFSIIVSVISVMVSGTCSP